MVTSGRCHMIYGEFLDELAYTGDAAILGSLKENILVTFVLPR